MSENRVLVTGGCGFVGAALTNLLARQGHDVVVVDAMRLGSRENLAPDVADEVRLVPSDIRDEDTLRRCFETYRPQAVYHLAAIHFIPDCNRNPKLTVDVNVGGTQSVLEACRATDSIESVVLASTAAVYAPSDSAHDESSRIGPTDIYGVTKLATEQLGELFHAQTRLPVGVARLFNVFGPGETNPHLIPAVIAQLQNGGGPLRLGNLTTKRDYVFTDDIAAGLVKLAGAARERGRVTCNLGREEEVDGEELVRVIGSASGREATVETDPARVRVSDRPHLLSDCSHARELLGWRAEVDLRVGIERALERPVAPGLEIS